MCGSTNLAHHGEVVGAAEPDQQCVGAGIVWVDAPVVAPRCDQAPPLLPHAPEARKLHNLSVAHGCTWNACASLSGFSSA